MKRLYLRLAPAVTALFALGAAAPRAGLFYHEHGRGEHPHVHAEGDAPHNGHAGRHHAEGHFVLHAHEHDEGHAAHTAGAARHRHASAALEPDESTHSGHWHEQPRFQRGVAPTLPFVPSVTPAETVAERARALAARVAAADLRARGPPLFALS